jgi:hypothetical protein
MNVIRCPNCQRDLIAEEVEAHSCEGSKRPFETVTTLYYSAFIPLKVDGRDVAILVSEDGKTLYNIKPRQMKRAFKPRGDEIEPGRDSRTPMSQT